MRRVLQPGRLQLAGQQGKRGRWVERLLGSLVWKGRISPQRKRVGSSQRPGEKRRWTAILCSFESLSHSRTKVDTL